MTVGLITLSHIEDEQIDGYYVGKLVSRLYARQRLVFARRILAL